MIPATSASELSRRRHHQVSWRARRQADDAGGHLSQALAFEREFVGVMHEPIEDGVRNGWIADDVVPMLDGELACHDRRGAAVAIFHDLQ